MESTIKFNDSTEANIISVYYPGYGCEPSWKLTLIYNNHIIHTLYTNSDFEVGLKRKELEELAYRFFTQGELQLRAEMSPQASSLCYFCKKPTWKEGGISVWDIVYCKHCKNAADVYVEHKKQEKKEETEAKRKIKCRNASNASNESAKLILSGINLGKNWYLKTSDDRIYVFKILKEVEENGVDSYYRLVEEVFIPKSILRSQL